MSQSFNAIVISADGIKEFIEKFNMIAGGSLKMDTRVDIHPHVFKVHLESPVGLHNVVFPVYSIGEESTTGGKGKPIWDKSTFIITTPKRISNDKENVVFKAFMKVLAQMQRQGMAMKNKAMVVVPKGQYTIDPNAKISPDDNVVDYTQTIQRKPFPTETKDEEGIVVAIDNPRGAGKYLVHLKTTPNPPKTGGKPRTVRPGGGALPKAEKPTKKPKVEGQKISKKVEESIQALDNEYHKALIKLDSTISTMQSEALSNVAIKETVDNMIEGLTLKGKATKQARDTLVRTIELSPGNVETIMNQKAEYESWIEDLKKNLAGAKQKMKSLTKAEKKKPAKPKPTEKKPKADKPKHAVEPAPKLLKQVKEAEQEPVSLSGSDEDFIRATGIGLMSKKSLHDNRKAKIKAKIERALELNPHVPKERVIMPILDSIDDYNLRVQLEKEYGI
jgi:hypothetical protein